jgi:acetolactate synthase small subunit
MAVRLALCYGNFWAMSQQDTVRCCSSANVTAGAAEELLMVKVEFTPEEAEELRNVLENDLSDLRMEIVDTESHDYREMLKKRRDLLAKTIAQLKGA